MEDPTMTRPYLDDDDEDDHADEIASGEEEIESDILVVAKFAQLDVTRQETPALVLNRPTRDPAEIDLSDEPSQNIGGNTGKKDEDDDSSSISSSSSESEDEERNDDDVNMAADGVEDEDDGDEESEGEAAGGDGKRNQSGPLTKNEIPYGMAPLEPLPDQSLLLPNDRIVQALKVTAVQSNMLVASSLGSPVLDSGSVICNAQRVLIGRIDDVFGPVASPFYTVRLMSSAEPRPSIAIGDVLSWVEKFSFIVNCAALDTRGTDASNLVDEEAVESDDEDDEDYGDFADDTNVLVRPPVKGQPNQSQIAASTGTNPGLKGRGDRHHNRLKGRDQRVRRDGRAMTNVRKPQKTWDRSPPSEIANQPTSPVSISQAAPGQPFHPPQVQPTQSFAPSPVPVANLPPGWPQPRLPAGWPAPRF